MCVNLSMIFKNITKFNIILINWKKTKANTKKNDQSINMSKQVISKNLGDMNFFRNTMFDDLGIQIHKDLYDMIETLR